MLLGWMTSEIKSGLGAWSRMNQFRSIMGRAQPAILDLLVRWLAWLLNEWNLQRNGLDDSEEQVRPCREDGRDHIVNVRWRS